MTMIPAIRHSGVAFRACWLRGQRFVMIEIGSPETGGERATALVPEEYVGELEDGLRLAINRIRHNSTPSQGPERTLPRIQFP